MIVNTPISLGELIDKISILIIKEKNIKDNKKLFLIKNELKLLNDAMAKVVPLENIKNYLDQLVEINSQLWKIEDNSNYHCANMTYPFHEFNPMVKLSDWNIINSNIGQIINLYYK